MRPHPRSQAFTLVEVIVVAGILVVLMTVLVSMTNSTQILLKGTSAKIEQFQEARIAYESMTRKLAQATLNTFWDYDYPTVNGQPDLTQVPNRYLRNAELRFRSGQMLALTGGAAANGNLQPGHGVFFNAPLGHVDDLNTYGVLDNLINTWGYFVELGDDKDTLPPFLTADPPLVVSRTRYRLMEFMQPAEQLAVFTPAAQVPGNMSWFDKYASGSGGTVRPVRVLCENVIALVVLPRLSKTDEDVWMATPGNTSASKPTPPPLTLSNTPPTGSAPNGYGYDTTITTISDPVLNPRNQLPPVVQVVMVAIDEPSALRLQDKYGPASAAPDPKLGIDYSDLFLEPPTNQALLNPTKLIDDIAELENRLISKRVSYRVFSTNVSIRGAKWSKAQAN